MQRGLGDMQVDIPVKCPRCKAIDVRGIDFDIGPHYCPCGFVQVDAEGNGYALEDLDPSTIEKGKHYIVAQLKWRRAGKPERSDEEVERIRGICNVPCEMLGEDGSCRVCGCGVKQTTWLGDKIRWATENCPIGKW